VRARLKKTELPQAGILANVFRLAASLLLTVFVSLTAADPLVCPDGCADDAQHSGESSHPGACLSCQNGMASTEPLDPISAPAPIESHPKAVAFRLTVPPSHAIEHPPRFNT
jgi:hypothetical protein